ncbi:glycosyltransferase family 69 protein [Aspergillus carbonarius ITEM 5010]|uniref:Glycosyltransferase family 69 protein n=1 Tax=Aspergillus carbonarius (strain ITEM 5010) TaxID=602072 RepID=A0A1R3RXC0_ASPC5|nr:glycosyltransferase family 69 protein [Aspergillus carbonarius ITEM 5010]
MTRLTRGWYEPLARTSSEEDGEVELASFESSDSYSSSPRVFWVQYPLVPLLWVTGAVRRRIRRCIFKSSLTVRGIVTFLICTLLGLITFTFAFWPSYTHLPPHYRALRAAVQHSTAPGRGNPYNSTVFIAVSLYDKSGILAGGAWGQSLLDLIDMLGPDRVHLSIYENDSGPAGEEALQQLADRVPCNKTIVYDQHFDFTGFPTVTLPDGSTHVRRVTYLAEVRNRALRPLQQQQRRFDRLLFLNDVYFNPIDALQLLFSTHSHNGDKPDYRAACAVDFINPFKFYDTFASRDLEGYSMGIPFYPWFTTAGQAHSRHDVLRGTDAVRVRSCWGGMVAFDAAFFQHDGSINSPTSHYRGIQTPVQFRGEEDLFWEASECCLIHADIQRLPYPSSTSEEEEEEDSGIYMNPFVRVAYDPRSLSWLGITRRVERLYSPIHGILSRIVGLPRYNPRRTEIPGRESQELVWVNSQGQFDKVTRTAGPGGFCGRWELQVLRPRREDGEGGWMFVPVPPRRVD